MSAVRITKCLCVSWLSGKGIVWTNGSGQYGSNGSRDARRVARHEVADRAPAVADPRAEWAGDVERRVLIRPRKKTQ